MTLWDLPAHRAIGKVAVPDARKDSGRAFAAKVQFRPDGKELALASSAMGAVLLDLDPGSWRRLACDVANRTL